MNKVLGVSENEIAEFVDKVLADPELLKAIEFFYNFFELSKSNDHFKRVLEDYNRLIVKKEINIFKGFVIEEYERFNWVKREISRVMNHFIGNEPERKIQYHILPSLDSESQLFIVCRKYKNIQDMDKLKELAMSDFKSISEIFGKPHLMVQKNSFWHGTFCFYKLDKIYPLEKIKPFISLKIKLGDKDQLEWKFYLGRNYSPTLPLPFNFCTRLIEDGLLLEDSGLNSLLKWSRAACNNEFLIFDEVNREMAAPKNTKTSYTKLEYNKIERIRDQINELTETPEKFNRENAWFLLKYKFMYFERLTWEVAAQKAWEWLKCHDMVPTKDIYIQLEEKRLHDYFKKCIPEKLLAMREGVLLDDSGFNNSQLKGKKAEMQVVLENIKEAEKETPKKTNEVSANLKYNRIEQIRYQINELMETPEKFNRENAWFLLKYEFRYFGDLTWEVAARKAWEWLKRHDMVPAKTSSIKLGKKLFYNYFRKDFAENLRAKQVLDSIKHQNNYFAKDLNCDVNFVIDKDSIKLSQHEITKLIELLHNYQNSILAIINSEQNELRDKLENSVYYYFILSYAICINYSLPWQKLQTSYLQDFIRNRLSFTDIEYNAVVSIIYKLNVNNKIFKINRDGKPLYPINLFAEQNLTLAERDIQICKEELAKNYERFLQNKRKY